MDFFEHQDKARKNTKLLVVYFVLAVLCIIASVYFASVLVFHIAGSRQPPGVPPPELVLWDPRLLLYVALGTLGIVMIGSLYKTATLAKGGSAVAEALEGRLLNPNTTHPDERKLRNVVEEMALAAGLPVPKIYVLDHEEGINAFAAGHTPGDAAIGVTRGCMTMLTRDELQGVVGHEFSHILNGDMRLNVRIMGLLFGILCLAVIGRVLIFSRGGRDRNPLMLLGLALIVIGAIGVFFGRLIQAALSRQREFLADASAVQFTRNPAGLSGALQKIGGAGSTRSNPLTPGKPVTCSLETPWANRSWARWPPTHRSRRASAPSIRAGMEPSGPAASRQLNQNPRRGTKPSSSRSRFRCPGMPGARAGDRRFRHQRRPDGSRAAKPGQANAAAFALRRGVAEFIPGKGRVRRPRTARRHRARLRDAPQSGRELCARSNSRNLAGDRAGGGETTAALWPEVAPIVSRARLPLVNLALPALRQLRPDEFEQFSQTCNGSLRATNRLISLNSSFRSIVRRHLASQSGETRPASIQYDTLKPLLRDCSVVLSALANASSRNAGEIEKAFRTGAPHLGAKADGLQLLPRAECGLEQLDTALDRLALAAPRIKKKVIEACVQVVGADGVIQEREGRIAPRHRRHAGLSDPAVCGGCRKLLHKGHWVTRPSWPRSMPTGLMRSFSQVGMARFGILRKAQTASASSKRSSRRIVLSLRCATLRRSSSTRKGPTENRWSRVAA
jgi:Zn-dependent protease with chaperone function